MLLSQLLKGFEKQIEKHNYSDFEIKGIELDSRQIKNGFIFFALQGDNMNGADFIPKAIENGASVIVCSKSQDGIERKYSNVIVIKHEDPREFIGEILRVFYKEKPAHIFGVTGTKGKTSVTDYVRQSLEILGYRVASIGSLGVKFNGSTNHDDTLTMPDVVTMHKTLNELKLKNNVDYVMMEMTSQGMKQKRTAGIDIEIGAFTNFFKDHMECHGTMDNYFKAKMILFDNILVDGSPVVLNADIDQFNDIKKISENKNHKIIGYGKNGDIKLLDIISTEGNQKAILSYKSKNYELNTSIIGSFQIYNLLCALGILISSVTNPIDEIIKTLEKVKAAEGRGDLAGITKNGAYIYIDYAHTPDGLEKILNAMREHLEASNSSGRLILVFGCGGDRDPSKRPIMGKIANDMADVVLVTEDNPRNEEPEVIRKDIIMTCSKGIEITEGREFAVRKAIQMANKGDIVLLAAKGHEKYMLGKNLEKTYFNEFEIVKDEISK